MRAAAAGPALGAGAGGGGAGGDAGGAGGPLLRRRPPPPRLRPLHRRPRPRHGRGAAPVCVCVGARALVRVGRLPMVIHYHTSIRWFMFVSREVERLSPAWADFLRWQSGLSIL